MRPFDDDTLILGFESGALFEGSVSSVAHTHQSFRSGVFPRVGSEVLWGLLEYSGMLDRIAIGYGTAFGISSPSCL